MTVNLGTNMINRQMSPFFSSTLWALSLVSLIFAFQYISPWHYVLVCKIHIYMLKMTLWILLYKIMFYIKFANFGYITCFNPNLIPAWPRSHGLLKMWGNCFWQSQVYHFIICLNGLLSGKTFSKVHCFSMVSGSETVTAQNMQEYKLHCTKNEVFH